MKVRVVRKVITYVEEVMELEPKKYCELRADLSPLKVSTVGNVSIEVQNFEPLADDDALELFDFFHSK